MTTTLFGHERFAVFERPRVRLVLAILVGWVPVVLLGEIGLLMTGRADPLLRDLSVHVRLLVAVPLFLFAELALSAQATKSLGRLNEGFIGGGDRAHFDALVRTYERWSGALAAQVLIGALAIFAGVATLVGWRSTGAPGGPTPSGLNAARLWFDAIALPLFLFLLGRSLWRWAVWVRTLTGVGRLHLQLAPAHPDRRGGISFLTWPSLAFNGPFLMAVSSVLCANWGMQIMKEGAHLLQFRNLFLVFAVVGELLAFAPLLVLAPRLLRARFTDLISYGGLATDYVRRFGRRWMAPANRAELLGTSDIQSLTDLGNAYREVVEKGLMVPFVPRDLIMLAAAMLLPVVPLLVATVPLDALIKKMVPSILGS